jgi:hypothetical protein
VQEQQLFLVVGGVRHGQHVISRDVSSKLDLKKEVFLAEKSRNLMVVGLGSILREGVISSIIFFGEDRCTISHAFFGRSGRSDVRAKRGCQGNKLIR